MFWNRKNKEKEESVKNKVIEFKKQIKLDLNYKYKFGDKMDDGNIFVTTKVYGGDYAYLVFNPKIEMIEYMGFNESYLKELAIKQLF